MDIEKQTYLNTEQLQTLFEKKGKAVACYGSSARYGGVRFTMRSKGKVSLSVAFYSIGADATICVDGLTVAVTRYLRSHYELSLSKGEHVFDVGCTSHGGFTLSVEGGSVEEGARYFDRVGGHSADGEIVVFTSNGADIFTIDVHAPFADVTGHIIQTVVVGEVPLNGAGVIPAIVQVASNTHSIAT